MREGVGKTLSISTQKKPVLTPGDELTKCRKWRLGKYQASDKRGCMDKNIIYWASVGPHEEFTDACVEQAKALTDAGFVIEHRKNQRSVRFLSESLGDYWINPADVYGHIHANREDALATALLLGVSMRNPMMLLVANGRGQFCTPYLKRNFLQAAMSHLEKEDLQRIMAVSGLLSTNETFRLFLNKPEHQSDNFCHSIAF
jgi:hypothetical protein